MSGPVDAWNTLPPCLPLYCVCLTSRGTSRPRRSAEAQAKGPQSRPFFCWGSFLEPLMNCHWLMLKSLVLKDSASRTRRLLTTKQGRSRTQEGISRKPSLAAGVA